MLFIPNNLSKVKIKKFKQKSSLGEYKSYYLKFGNCGLKSQESGILTSKHLELLNKVLSKRLKKVGKFWFRLNVQYQLTKKPNQTRMGKGKGKLSDWVCEVKRGRVVIELAENIPLIISLKLLNKCKVYLPFKSKITLKKN